MQRYRVRADLQFAQCAHVEGDLQNIIPATGFHRVCGACFELVSTMPTLPFRTARYFLVEACFGQALPVSKFLLQLLRARAPILGSLAIEFTREAAQGT